MSKRKYFGKSALIVMSLALLLASVWEVCVRLDAMYAPIKMFFSMALGESIPLSTAMNYFDFSIFESLLWLTGCMLVSLLSLALSNKPKGRVFILSVSLAMALYGLTREGTFLTDLWRLVQPALLIMISALSALNLLSPSVRRKPRATAHNSAPDAPRMTDAPRLKNISFPDAHSDSDRRAG